jgi:hypothetical protein
VVPAAAGAAHGKRDQLDSCSVSAQRRQACEVFWNAVKVGSYGKLPPDPVWYGFIAATDKMMSLGPAQSGELAIRVWKAPIVFLNSPEEGGLVEVPRVGSAEAVAGLQIAAEYRHLQAGLFSLCLACIAGIVCAVALLLWLRNRNQQMLLWLSPAMAFPVASYLLLETARAIPFRIAYGVIGPLIWIHDIAIWFLLVVLLGLQERRRLVRWTRIIALTGLALVLVDTVCQFFDWTVWPPHRFLMIDVGTTLPVIYMELWGLALVFAAFGKRLDLARWVLAIAVLLSDVLVALSDTTGLGQRWTHWTLANKLRAPLFTIGGTPLTAQMLVNAVLLAAVLYSAWRYLLEHNRQQNALEQEMRNARAVQQILIPDEIPNVPGFRIESVYKPAG